MSGFTLIFIIFLFLVLVGIIKSPDNRTWLWAILVTAVVLYLTFEGYEP